MNQTLNGKIKPLKALKTTQLQRAPLCHPGSPSEREREGGFDQAGVFRGPPLALPISWLPASPKGKFYPASRGLGCQVGKKNPICFQSGSSLPSTQPFSSPRSPAPSPQRWRVRQRGLGDAFFFPPLFFLFFFSSKNVCGLLCPPHPSLLPGTCSSTALSTLGPAKSLSALSPATVTGSENSQMTEDFQPRAFGKKKENKRQIIFLDEKK